MASNVLDGVVALVCCRTDGDNMVQMALSSVLQALGAKVASRFSKDVTHIIFRQKLDATEQEKAREESALSQLFDKAYKVMPPPYIVTPLWVYVSRDEGKRAMERQYALVKPGEHTPKYKYIKKTPGSLRKSAEAALNAVASLRKPRRRQIAEAGLSPSPSHAAGIIHLPKRARTTYRTAAIADAAGAVFDTEPNPGASTANETDENLPAQQLPAAKAHLDCKPKPSGCLQPSNVINQLPLNTAIVPVGKQMACAAPTHSVPVSSPKTKVTSVGKRRALAASAAKATASVIDAAFGIVGSGKGSWGMKLRRGLLGGRHKGSRHGGAAVAVMGGNGVQTAVLMQPECHGGDLDLTHTAASVEGAAGRRLVQAAEMLGDRAADVTWPYGNDAAEPDHVASSHGGDQPTSVIPDTSLHRSQPQPMNTTTADPTSALPTTSPQLQQQQGAAVQDQTDGAQPTGGRSQLDDSCESDTSEEDVDVDALLNPPAAVQPDAVPQAGPQAGPTHTAMPPRCPSLSPSMTPLQLPPGHPNAPPAISMPTSPAAGRSSPSPGRIRQQWSIPPAVEAARASNNSPAWMLRAEAALTQVAQSPRPPLARSPSRRESPARRHTRSMSTSSLESNDNSPGNAKPALSDQQSSEDDMMLGGVPNIVAKTISPAGKLASATTLGTKSKTKPVARSKKSSLTEEVSKALAMIKVGEGDDPTRPAGVARSQSAARGAKSADKVAPKGRTPRGGTPGPSANVGPATGKQTPAAVSTRVRSGGASTDVQRRSTSVPPGRPGWGVNTVPVPEATAPAFKTTRVLRSTVSMPVKHIASVIDSTMDHAKANKNGLASSQKLFTRVQPRSFGNRLAASAEGLLQASAVEVVRKAKGNVKLPSVAEKTTAASRARTSNSQVVEAPPPPSFKAATPAPSAVVNATRPKLKYLAFTSVPSEIQQMVKAAVRRLQGLRMCIDGNEDGRITHLVIGAERRTLKALLAIANGAHLLSPAWVSDSLAAEEWLPEDQYPADTRFTLVAERVRDMQVSGRLLKPLEGHMVFIHVPTNAHGGDRAERPSERRHTLQRLVQALGGKVAPARACTLCIACEDVRRPKGLPEGVKMIRDEWLFLVAENYQQVGMAEHMIVDEEE